MKVSKKLFTVGIICILVIQMISIGFVKTSYAEEKSQAEELTEKQQLKEDKNDKPKDEKKAGEIKNEDENNYVSNPASKNELFSIAGTESTLREDPTQKINLRVGYLDNGGFETTKTEFWTDEPVGAAVDMGISGYGVNIFNAKLRITVPKTDGIKNSLKFTDSVNAKLNEKTEDANNWYMTYTFDPLTGANAGTYALPFTFDSATTNENEEVKVKAELFDGDGKLLKSAEHLYKSKVHKMDSELKVIETISIKYDSSDKSWVYRVSPSDDHPGVTNTVNGVPVDSFIPIVKLDMKNGDIKGLGHPNPKNIEFVVYLPPEASAKDDNGWKYDKATNTLRLLENKPLLVGNSESYGRRFSMNFKGAPINKVYKVRAEYTVNKGESGEYRLPDREVNLKFEAIPFSEGGTVQIYKSGHDLFKYNTDPSVHPVDRSHNYYYMKDGRYFIGNTEFTELGMRYSTNITARNNGKGSNEPNGGRTAQIYDITTAIDDDRVHFVGYSVGGFVPVNTHEGWEKLVKKANENFSKTPNTLYGVDKDGNLTELARNIKTWFEAKGEKKSYVKIKDPDRKFVALKLVFDTPLELDNVHLDIYDYVDLMSAEKAKWNNKENGNKQTYSGHSSITATFKGVNMAKTVYNDVKGGKEGYLNLIPTYPLASAEQNPNQNVVYESGGTQTSYIVGPDMTKGNWGAYKTAKNVKSVTLLPPGYTCGKDENGNTLPLFKGAQIGDGHGGFDPWRDFDASKIKVIENYKNTGRTAVIVDYGDVNCKETRRVKLNIVATKQVRHGEGIVENYYIYDDNDYISPYKDEMKYVDKLDLDNDGNTNETFTQMKSILNFIPPYELIMNKYVKLTDDTSTALGASGDLGGNIDYNISIYNQTIHPVKRFSMIDTMPAKGDHSIVENDEHKYLPRGSGFSTPLRMAIEDYAPNAEVMEFFDVFYQLSPQGKDLASVRDGEWLTKAQISDFSKVKSFKLVLKNGKEIVSKREMIVAIPSRIPFDLNLKEGSDSGFNTAAISTNDVDYLEGNSAKVNFVKYGISGKVYYDLNGNGIFDSDDKPAKNVNITLINKNTGETAVIPDGHNTPITAVTDSEGNYKATVYNRGDYTVKFSLNGNNKNEEFNKKVTIGHGVSDVDVTQKSGNSILPESVSADGKSALSSNFSLNPVQKKSVQNAALIGYNDIKITKTGKDGNKTERLKDVEFALYKIETVNGKEKEVKVGECKTDGSGEYVFKRLGFGQYIVKETSAAPSYNNDNVEGKKIYINSSTAEYRIDFVDTKIKGNIKVHKVDEKGNSLQGVEFTLRQDNRIIAKSVTDESGYAQFKNVAYGNYEIIESKGLDGYEASKEVYQAEIKKNDQLISFEVVNKKIPRKPPVNPPKDKPKRPNTSDISGIVKWSTLCILSIALLTTIYAKRRKID